MKFARKAPVVPAGNEPVPYPVIVQPQVQLLH